MTGVLVLNAGYEPLHRVSLAHAVRMLHRRVAVVEEAVDGRTFGPYPLPAVLRLVRYVQMRWRHRGVPTWSRAGMLARDGHVCAYCGRRALTVDHVRAPQPRRRQLVAQHGRRLRGLQPPQARPHARRGGDAAAGRAARADLPGPAGVALDRSG